MPVDNEATYGLLPPSKALCLHLTPKLTAVLTPRLPARTQIWLVGSYEHCPGCERRALGTGPRFQPERDGLSGQANLSRERTPRS